MSSIIKKVETVKNIFNRIVNSESMPERLFVITVLCFGLFLVINIPPFFGYDESHHYYRAYQQSGFNILPQSEDQGGILRYGGYIPINIVELGELTHDQLATSDKNPLGNIDFVYTDNINKILSSPASQSTKFVAFEGSSAYSPIAYIPTIIGLWIAKLFNSNIETSLFIARLMNLTFYIIICYFAIKLAPRTLKFVIGAVALIPMSIHQASTISADGMAVSIGLILVSTAFAYLKNRNQVFLYISIGSATALALVKPTYVFLSFLVPFIYLYSCSVRMNTSAKKLLTRKIYIRLGVILAIIMVPTVVWYFISAGVSDHVKNLLIGSPVYQQIDTDEQTELFIEKPYIFTIALLKTVLLNIQEILQGAFGRVTWVGVALPFYSILINALLILLLVPTRKEMSAIARSNMFWLTVFGSALLTTAAIYGALYLTFNPVGAEMISWVQGRYFTLLIPIYILPIVFLTNMQFSTKFSKNVLYFTITPLLVAHSVVWYVLT